MMGLPVERLHYIGGAMEEDQVKKLAWFYTPFALEYTRIGMPVQESESVRPGP